MSESNPFRFKIANPADAAVAVPHMLGFEPTDSLVVFTVGAAPHVPPLVRIDHPHDPAAILLTAATLARSYNQATHSGEVSNAEGPGVAALLLSYTDNVLHARDAMTATAAMLEALNPIMAPQVNGRRWTDHSDILDPRTRPEAATSRDLAQILAERPTGLIDQGTYDRAAAHQAVTGGLAPLASRAALGERIALDPEQAAKVQARLDHHSALRAADSDTVGEWDRLDPAALAALVIRHRDHVMPFSDDDAARILAVLPEGDARDAVILAIARESIEGFLAVWTDLARRTPEPHRARVLLTVALAAWVNGNGALARIALDAIDAAERPGLALYEIVDSLLTNAVPPSFWVELLAAFQGDTAPDAGHEGS